MWVKAQTVNLVNGRPVRTGKAERYNTLYDNIVRTTVNVSA